MLAAASARAALLALAAVSLAAADPPEKDKDKTPAKDGPGFFFPIDGARDCAFDQVRERLYVTTGEKLVVLDTKNRKRLEEVERPGGLQGCAIAPDFSFLAVAPATAQYVYRIGTKWDKAADMPVTRIKFKAPSEEPGVYAVCVGFDGTILFSTTYSGSGGTTLRRITPKNKVEEVGKVNMNAVLAPGGGRRYAALAEGNISNGPLRRYDFKERKLVPVAEMGGFPYEIGLSRDAKMYARPHAKGCDLLDAKGARLGSLDGEPVIAAAFHPSADTLFVLRHGSVNVEEYDVLGRKVANSYPLDKPLVIKADVNEREVVDLQPVGRDAVTATFRKITSVNFHTYESGRVKVSEDGKRVFAVVPNGVYVFPVKTAPPGEDKPRPKVKDIGP